MTCIMVLVIFIAAVLSPSLHAKSLFQAARTLGTCTSNFLTTGLVLAPPTMIVVVLQVHVAGIHYHVIAARVETFVSSINVTTLHDLCKCK